MAEWSIDGTNVVRADGTVVRSFDTPERATAYLSNLEKIHAAREKAAVTMSDGSYPISDQHSANSAWKLRAHSKNHSEAEVMSHIRRAVKKLGLSMPGPSEKTAEVERAAHDLIFFEKRSTPLVVSKGAAPSSNSNYTEKYGKQVSRRAATSDEEAKIAKGQWVQVDSSGKKSGEPGYKKTKYRPALVQKSAAAPAGANAPYKILKRGDKFVVVNNAGETKATFFDRDKALAYQRALYANVPGAGARADKTKFTGNARNRVPVKKDS